MVIRIDAFAHATPPAFHDAMLEAHPTDELRNLFFEPLWNVERRIQDMDDHGIDQQILSLANPPIWRGIEPADALPLTRIANDTIREMADEYPDRLDAIATVPFVTEPYIDEFHRCLDDLDMRGVQIFSNVAGRPIDSPGHMALYEAAEAAGVPVWIHPQFHDWYPWLDEFEIHRIFGWPFDTTVAMARMVFGGVFERCPDLDVITHHMGGMVPFFIGRISTFFEARVNYPDLYPHFEAPDFSEPVGEQFRRFYGDSVVGGAEASLELGLSVLGDDGVVFATDYPFGPDGGRRFMRQAVDVVESIDDSDVREAVYGGTLSSLC